VGGILLAGIIAFLHQRRAWCRAVLRENPIQPAAVDFLMLPVDCGAMISWLFLVRRALTGMVRSRASQAGENSIRNRPNNPGG